MGFFKYFGSLFSKSPPITPVPHICPSGFGDLSREEVLAAIELAEITILCDDHNGKNPCPWGMRPEDATSGEEYERRTRLKEVYSAENSRLWASKESIKTRYRELLRRRWSWVGVK